MSSWGAPFEWTFHPTESKAITSIISDFYIKITPLNFHEEIVQQIEHYKIDKAILRCHCMTIICGNKINEDFPQLPSSELLSEKRPLIFILVWNLDLPALCNLESIFKEWLWWTYSGALPLQKKTTTLQWFIHLYFAINVCVIKLFSFWGKIFLSTWNPWM